MFLGVCTFWSYEHMHDTAKVIQHSDNERVQHPLRWLHGFIWSFPASVSIDPAI